MPSHGDANAKAFRNCPELGSCGSSIRGMGFSHSLDEDENIRTRAITGTFVLLAKAYWDETGADQ